jgi:hypothetical protein
MKMTNLNPCHVVTGEALLSYVSILRPVKKPNQDEAKYSVTVLVPKSDLATKARIDAAVEAAIQRGATEKWGGRPAQAASPVYDGDGKRPSDGEPFGAECRGHWVMTATCKAQNKPEVVDANRNPILNESEIYSGIFGRVSLDFFPYGGTKEVPKKGVGCALGNVQKLHDGTSLAGGTTAEEDFGEPQPAPQAAYAPAPQQPAYVPAQPQNPQSAPQQPAYAVPGYPPYCPPLQPQQAAYAPYGAVNPITGQPIVG